MTCNNELDRAVEQGDATRLTQLLPAHPLELHRALKMAVSRGHVQCVEALMEHVDITHNNCEYFRHAVTKQQVECARLLVPSVHAGLPRAHVYVEDVITRKSDQCSDSTKKQLLELCCQVFDITDSRSRALCTAVYYNTQYAIDVLYPLSNIQEALALLRTMRGVREQDIEGLQARFERDTIIQHISFPSGHSVRKM